MNNKAIRLGVFSHVDSSARKDFVSYCAKRNIPQFKGDGSSDFTVKVTCKEDLMFTFLRNVAMNFGCTIQMLYDDKNTQGMDVAAAIVKM